MDIQDFNAMVARNIRFLREERGWSIEELAAKTDTIGKSLLIKIESNATEIAHKKRINQEYIDDIAQTLGVSPPVITEDDHELIRLFDVASQFPVLINEKSTSKKDEYQKSATELILKCATRGPREQAKALMFVGDFDYNLGMIDLAIRELEHAVKLAEIAHDAYLQGEIMRYLANCYFVKGDFERVHKILSSSVVQFVCNTHDKRSRVLLLRGAAYTRQCRWVLAEKFYRESLSEAYKIVNHKIMVGRCLEVLGDFYKNTKKYSEAIETSKEAVVISENENDGLNVIYALKTIAEVYVELGDLPNAITYYRQALRKAWSIEDFRKIDLCKLRYCVAKYTNDLEEMIFACEGIEESDVPKKEKSDVFTEIARLAFDQTKTKIAQQFYEKAIQILQ